MAFLVAMRVPFEVNDNRRSCTRLLALRNSSGLPLELEWVRAVLPCSEDGDDLSLPPLLSLPRPNGGGASLPPAVSE